MATYTLEAGRCIIRNGKPLATIHAVKDERGAYNPVELDDLARMTVDALNLCHSMEDEWPEVFAEEDGRGEDAAYINGCDAVDALCAYVHQAADINGGAR